MKIMTLLKDLVIYKEPKPYHQFELLEDEETEKIIDPAAKEAAMQDNDPPSPDQSGGGEAPEKDKTQEEQPKARKPMSFEEWNNARKAGKQQDATDPKQQGKSGSEQQKGPASGEQSGGPASADKNKKKYPISNDLKKNLDTIKREMNSPKNQDVVIREFRILQKCDAFLVFIDGMADNTMINDFILRQLMARESTEGSEGGSSPGRRNEGGNGPSCGSSGKGGFPSRQTGSNGGCCSRVEGGNGGSDKQDEKSGNSSGGQEDPDVCSVGYIVQNLLSANQIAKFSDIDSVIKQVLYGLTAIFIDGSTESIVVETRGFKSRSVSTPMTETVIKGSQEAYVENLRTNLTLIRKIIKSRDLITEIMPVGKVDQINCAIVYMNEIVNPKIVEEVKRRITSLDIDFASGNGVLDQLIEDHPYSIFPQIISTERPDRTASFLMDGKVALICDGIPFASIVPTTFFHMFHTSEDAVMRWQYGTFLRYVRLIASFSAVFLPGLYIALTLYHKEMIPNELMASLHKARENVPFPTVVEVLLMEISFEIIREAGIRVPGVVGQTLGIIGAIVLGQAAVSAGLVSPVLIIIVAITGLGSFAIPNFSLSFAIRILRFLFIFLGAMAGFYGISAGMLVFGGIACSMKSFGVPYFSPVAPKTKSNPDLITRAPAWRQTSQPDFLNTRNRKRGGNPVRKWAEGEEGGNP